MANLTVANVAYVQTTDVDVEAQVNAKVLDEQTNVCVARARNALEQPALGYESLHVANMSVIFDSMLATHRAIKKVLGFGWDKPEAIDALALARLSLEGLYTLCLMFEGSQYVDRYLQHDWKNGYVKFLLQREETKNLPRCAEYNKYALAQLEALADIFGITEAQRLTIDRDELGTPLPTGVAPVVIPKFPMPGGAIDAIVAGSPRRKMLERLYPEYRRLCSFAHGSPAANLLKGILPNNSKYSHFWSEQTLKDTFHREVEEYGWTISRLAIIQSAAELTMLYPHDAELRAGALDAWEEFSDGVFLGRAIWNIRTKALLDGPS